MAEKKETAYQEWIICDFWSKYEKIDEFSAWFLSLFLFPSKSGEEWLEGSLDKSMKLTLNKLPFLSI